MQFDECSMEYATDDFTAQVLWDKERKTHVLVWTDGINEWRRDYENLGIALIALGVLLHSPNNDLDDRMQTILGHFTTN